MSTREDVVSLMNITKAMIEEDLTLMMRTTPVDRDQVLASVGRLYHHMYQETPAVTIVPSSFVAALIYSSATITHKLGTDSIVDHVRRITDIILNAVQNTTQDRETLEDRLCRIVSQLPEPEISLYLDEKYFIEKINNNYYESCNCAISLSKDNGYFYNISSVVEPLVLINTPKTQFTRRNNHIGLAISSDFLNATKSNFSYIPTNHLNALDAIFSLYPEHAQEILWTAVRYQTVSIRSSDYIGWIIIIDFLKKFLPHRSDFFKVADIFQNVFKATPRIFPHRQFCLVEDFPNHLHVVDNEMHCDDGPSVTWRDGYELHQLHDVRVKKTLITSPEKITPEEIDTENNQEVRRWMMERYGYERYVTSGPNRIIHANEHGTLYHFARENECLFLSVENGTVEPDGTRRRYMLRVPPTCATATEAVAWTYGLDADQYQSRLIKRT